MTGYRVYLAGRFGRRDEFTVDRIFDGLRLGEITEDSAREGVKALIAAASLSADEALAMGDAIVPSPDRVAGLREAVAAWFRRNGTCFTYDDIEKHRQLPDELAEQIVASLPAALLAEPVPGLDVERLAAEAFGEVMARIVEPWASGPVLAKHGGDA